MWRDQVMTVRMQCVSGIDSDVVIGFAGGRDKEGDAAVQADGSVAAKSGTLRCGHWDEGALGGIELDCFGLNRFPLIWSVMYCRDEAL